MIEVSNKLLPFPNVKMGFHSPYITRMNHLHMHVLYGDILTSRWRYWIEFGNRFFFKDAEQFIFKSN